MPEIRCRVGRLRNGLSIPADYRIGSKTIPRHFEDASRDGLGAAAIELVLDASDRDAWHVGAEWPVTSLDLMEGLREIRDGQPGSIGLLFADKFKERDDVFGYMFDTGYNPDIDPRSSYNELPREGCAVFVDAIRCTRSKQSFSDARIKEEILFTVAHELGHVFNLWHLDEPSDPLSFMRSSAHMDAPPRFGAWRFLDRSPPRLHQRAFLSKCFKSDYVTPGKKPFGVRGAEGPPDDNLHQRARRRSDLELRLHMKPRRFHAFEPVELDVELRAPGPRGRRRRVPDRLDPAYEEFKIWIERPDGDRRQYRPFKRFCGVVSARSIESGRPFRRDVSLFMQADGYTFRQVGVHRIEATFVAGPRRILRSNKLEVEVLPALPRSAAYEALERSLRRPEAARRFFYRRGTYAGREVDRLADFARRHRRTHAAASIWFAQGWILTERWLRKPSSSAKRAAREALELLRRVEQHDEIGDRRRTKAHERVERLGPEVARAR